MCPHVYSTESGACSRQTTHSFEGASPDFVVSATAESTAGMAVGGADVTVSRTFPTDRRTGTGGGVEGKLRRGACDCTLDEACLLGTED